MGFDLYGHKATSEKGDYFRNNIWWWRPLWEFVEMYCSDILEEQDILRGNYNDGHLITEEKALALAERLETLVKLGLVKLHEQYHVMRTENLPRQQCEKCKGKRVLDNDNGEKCNMCDGKGTREHFEKWYRFETKNVEEFIEFCKESGGFTIC